MIFLRLIRKKLSNLIAYLYIISKIPFRNSKRINNENVLIIQWGNIGDALIDAKSIISLTEYYEKKGKIVTVTGKNEVKIALDKILEIRTLNFVILENGRLTVNSIKKTLSGLNKDGYETIIALDPWYNWPSLYIPSCLPCNESLGAFPERYSNVLKLILSGVYKNRITVPLDMPQVQRNILLIKMIGISDFQTEIAAIPPKDIKFFPHNSYIVISVDSSDTNRRWVTDNFIELVGRLLERYSYDIYLTGVNVEPDVIERYKRSFAGNDRVKITIGKLPIDEWIETIRESKFVVSLDSGAVHVAAGTGTTCFCLTGVWDGRRIMPYAVDEQMPGTKEPICVYRTDIDLSDLKCYACLQKWHFGWGNKECNAQRKSGLPCMCLSKITVDDVMSVIEKAEHDGMIC